MHTPSSLPIPLLRGLTSRLADANPPLYSDNVSMWHHVTGSLQNSFYRVLSLLLAVLPGILAFFVAVFIFTLLGMGVSAMMRRLLVWVRFDERLTRNRADWTPSSSPTELFARASFWTCVLLGLVIGVSAFDASYSSASNVPILLLPYVTHAIGALIVLLVGTLVARFLARSVLISAVNAQLQYARFLSLGVKWLVLVLTAAMVLDHLEIGGHIVALAFGILFGGIVLTLALAVGLGSRDLVTRSLERGVERATEHSTIPNIPAGTGAGESFRHF
ncbi:MAG TPA: hypothetical protein VGL22_09225 [Terracidiphilus sp.]